MGCKSRSNYALSQSISQDRFNSIFPPSKPNIELEIKSTNKKHQYYYGQYCPKEVIDHFLLADHKNISD